MYTMTFIPDTPNINNKLINLNFNRDINIYVSDFIDETAITWRVFVTTSSYKDCMKLPLAESRETLPAYRNDLPCTWHNSAPTSDCGGNTRLFVPPSRVPAIYEGRNHVLVRPSNLSPLVKHKKLGITTQGHNPQNLSLVPEAGPSTSGSTDHEVTPNTPQRCIR